MAGFALVPSLLPRLSAEWSLSATAGGWLSGSFFFGYIVAVPLLASLTDRFDARRVYLASAGTSSMALLGFAAFADGLGSAVFWWWLAGLGLAGTYMPGLKALTDRLPRPVQSRGTACYTATFGVGAGVSYFWIELAQPSVTWPSLFVVASGCTALSLLLVTYGVTSVSVVAPAAGHRRRWWSVLRDRRILAYCGGYFGHNWELFGFRAWLVAFLTWVHGTTPHTWTSHPGVIAAVATFLAVPASVLGNECAHRWGRQRWLRWVMPCSALLALAVASSVDLSRSSLVLLILVYAACMNLDSAALTAGLLTETAAEVRGTALALYSTIGFTGAFVGPVVFGVALDAFGSGRWLGWAAAFVALAIGVTGGRLAIGTIKEAVPRSP